MAEHAMFTIKIKRKALKSLEKASSKQKQDIKDVILILKKDPIPYKKTNICKMRGYDSTYRIRSIENQRVVYEVLWKEKTILIHYIGARKKAYE
ncbi:MAG: type II toxin-antitoxin system RelE/ParE family toxin [Candidatus Bathyarchaeota archaeon]|nr:type II toxin-antitoxin system RelE/ParE family toxin [Candidatus Bathyarchaeota archaeon]